MAFYWGNASTRRHRNVTSYQFPSINTTTARDKWADITHVVEDAPWKTAEQLVAENFTGPLHQPIHGRIIPLFRGAYKRQLDLFWANAVDADGRASFALGLGRNEFQKAITLLRVIADETVIYDQKGSSPTFSGMTMTFYDGIDNAIDPTMLARDGAAQTPAYSGYAYLFFKDFDTTDFGYRIPIITAEWTDAATAADPVFSAEYLAGVGEFVDRSPTALCYDTPLNRFYVVSFNDGETAEQIGTVDVDSEVEFMNVTVVDSNSQIMLGLTATAIIGTDYVLMNRANESNGTNEVDALVNTLTGHVVARFDDGDAERRRWLFSQPFLGGTDGQHIAVGHLAETTDTDSCRLATMLVDVVDLTLTELERGTDSIDGSSGFIVTPGPSTVSATTFYIAEKISSGSIYQASTDENQNITYLAIHTISSGTITGIRYVASEDCIMLSVRVGSTNYIRLIVADVRSTEVWEVIADTLGSDGYEVLPDLSAMYPLI